MTDNPSSVESLIKALFYKAGERTGKHGVKNAMAADIRNWLMKNRRFDVSEKTLTRQYDRYILNDKESKGAPPSARVQDEYAMYLGYENYSDFIVQTNNFHGGEKTGSPFSPENISGTVTNVDGRRIIHAETYEEIAHKEEINVGRDYVQGDKIVNKNGPETKKSKKRNNLILYIVIFTAVIVLIILWILKAKNEEKLCLFWKSDHFESASCEGASEDEKEFMISPNEWQDTYKDFRKIDPTTTTRFFNSSGKAIVWYQFKDGQYEFFNQPGVHPVNGRKLLPVKPSVVDDYFESLQGDDEPNIISYENDPYADSRGAYIENGGADLSKTTEEVQPKGKYCFRNESDKTLKTYIQDEARTGQQLILQPKEQACVYLPVDEYQYSTFINGELGQAIASGTITVRENREGSISLSIPEKERVSREPDKSSSTLSEKAEPTKDCSKGDFCIKNSTTDVLHIRIGDKTDGPLGSTFYLHLTVPPQGEECFYDIPAIAYTVQYLFNEMTLNNLHKYTNIKVTGCQTNTKVF